MTNGSGKHPKKKAAKGSGKTVKTTAADLSREQLTKNVKKSEKPAS